MDFHVGKTANDIVVTLTGGVGGAPGAPGAPGLQGPAGPKGAQGPQGTPGVQGVQGVAGVKGDQGLQGPPGNIGPKGDIGLTGPAGAGVTYKGVVATVGALPPSLNTLGDCYTVTADNHRYVWNGAWQDDGPAGTTGATGPQGPQGAIGPPGAQGASGVPGAQGAQGIPGTPGSQGPQGLPGSTGSQGPQGAIGPQGIQGVKGDTGTQGLQGVKGDKGDIGNTGATGPAGAGITYKGTKTSVSALPPPPNTLGDCWTVTTDNHRYVWNGSVWLDDGPAGTTGATGAQGPQGLPGTPGATGAQGLPGTPGATGAQGAQGIKGDPGPIGGQGPQGVKGDTGASGAPGAVGAKGDKGDTGATGQAGAGITYKGVKLTVGALPPAPNTLGDCWTVSADNHRYVWNGTAWLDDGPAGTQGIQGIQGIPGTPGAAGLPGPEGDPGPQGIQGAPGAQGLPGTPGATGAAGVGVPIGGTVAQVLVKNSAANYDTVWQKSGVPAFGAIGQILAKVTATSLDTAWVTPPVGLPTGGTVNQVLGKTSSTNYAVAWQTVPDVTSFLLRAGDTMTGDLLLYTDTPPADRSATSRLYITNQLATKANISHTHLKSAITDFAHTHPISEIATLQSSLDLKAPLTSPGFLGVPTAPLAPAGVSSSQIATAEFVLATISGGGSFAPLVHTHAIADVTNLQTTLNGKAPTVHTHAIADVTSLQTTLDGKALTVHTHTTAQVTGLDTALAGKAATSHTHVMANITDSTAVLNLKANLVGPTAFSGVTTATTPARADDSQTVATTAYVKNKLLVEYLPLSGGTLTGPLTLSGPPTVPLHAATMAYVDAKAPAAHTHSIADVTNLQTSLDAKAALSHTHTTAQVTGLDTALAGKAATSHTHTTAQVTGLDAALLAKASLSSAAFLGAVSFAVAATTPDVTYPQVNSTNIVNVKYINDAIAGVVGGQAYQPIDVTLTGLAGLDTTLGFIEQTNAGATTFSKSPKGIAGPTSIPTRADGDARWALIAHTHTIANITDFASHTHTKAQITDFAHTHLKADITDFAHTHGTADIINFSVHTHTKAQITDFAHTHLIADITNFSTHTHTKAQITDFAHTHTTTDITNFSTHTHTKAQITDFAHTHTITDITNFSTHTHTKAQITDFAHQHVMADITDSAAVLSLKANLAGATFSGPVIFSSATAPVHSLPVAYPDDSNALATTAFVTDAIATIAIAGGAQPLDATLTALAGMTGTGLVERTGTDIYAHRALGIAATTSVPTRADADTRYAQLAAINTFTLAQTFNSPVTVNTNAVAGISLIDNNTGASAPWIYVLGNRSDGNATGAFSGGILLAKHRTDAAIASSHVIGRVLFGGAEDFASSATKATASIVAYATGTWAVGSTPTGLRAYVGSIPQLPNTANVTFGDILAWDILSTGVMDFKFTPTINSVALASIYATLATANTFSGAIAFTSTSLPTATGTLPAPEATTTQLITAAFVTREINNAKTVVAANYVDKVTLTAQSMNATLKVATGVAGTVAAPSLQIGDANTGLYYVATDRLGIVTGGAERVRIDGAGIRGGGYDAFTTYLSTGAHIPYIQTLATTFAASSSVNAYFNANSTSSGHFFAKSRATVIGGHAIVLDNDTLGNISFGGSDGVKIVEAARITAFVDSVPGVSNMPGRIVFLTTSSGVSPIERMRIDGSGNIWMGAGPNLVISDQRHFILRLYTGTLPTYATPGQLIYDDNVGVDKLALSTGTAWRYYLEATSAGALVRSLDVDGFRLLNLPDRAIGDVGYDADAINKKYADTKYPKTGGAITGNVSISGTLDIVSTVNISNGSLTVNKTGVSSLIYIDSDIGYSLVYFQKGGENRWWIGRDTTAEVEGTNAGSDFTLYALSDTQTNLGPVFTATRSTQVVNFPKIPTVTAAAGEYADYAPADLNKLATKAYVDGAIGATGGGIFVTLIGDTMTGALYLPSTTPTLPTQAVTKGWVDGRFAGSPALGSASPSEAPTTTAVAIPGTRPTTATTGTRIANTGYVHAIADTFYVPKAGGTLTGSITLTAGNLFVSPTAAASAYVYLSSDIAWNASILARTGTTNRWIFGKDGSENFTVIAYANDGINSDPAFSINRLTLTSNFYGPLTGTNANFSSTITAGNYIKSDTIDDGTSTTPAYFYADSDSTAYGGIWFRSAPSGVVSARWLIAKYPTSAGEDLFIRAYPLGTDAVRINNATRAVTLYAPLTGTSATFTSNIITNGYSMVSKDGLGVSAYTYLDSDLGTYGTIVCRTAEVNRWMFGKNTVDDFNIWAYPTTTAALALAISRSTQVVSFTKTPTINETPNSATAAGTTEVATTAYVKSVAALYLPLTGNVAQLDMNNHSIINVALLNMTGDINMTNHDIINVNNISMAGGIDMNTHQIVALAAPTTAAGAMAPRDYQASRPEGNYNFSEWDAASGPVIGWDKVDSGYDVGTMTTGGIFGDKRMYFIKTAATGSIYGRETYFKPVNTEEFYECSLRVNASAANTYIYAGVECYAADKVTSLGTRWCGVANANISTSTNMYSMGGVICGEGADDTYSFPAGTRYIKRVFHITSATPNDTTVRVDYFIFRKLERGEPISATIFGMRPNPDPKNSATLNAYGAWNSIAFARMVNYLGKMGGVAVIPPGTFDLGTPIDMSGEGITPPNYISGNPANGISSYANGPTFEIRGFGRATVLRRSAKVVGAQLIEFNYFSNFTLKDFTIDPYNDNWLTGTYTDYDPGVYGVRAGHNEGDGSGYDYSHTLALRYGNKMVCDNIHILCGGRGTMLYMTGKDANEGGTTPSASQRADRGPTMSRCVVKDCFLDGKDSAANGILMAWSDDCSMINPTVVGVRSTKYRGYFYFAGDDIDGDGEADPDNLDDMWFYEWATPAMGIQYKHTTNRCSVVNGSALFCRNGMAWTGDASTHRNARVTGLTVRMGLGAGIGLSVTDSLSGMFTGIVVDGGDTDTDTSRPNPDATYLSQVVGVQCSDNSQYNTFQCVLRNFAAGATRHIYAVRLAGKDEDANRDNYVEITTLDAPSNLSPVQLDNDTAKNIIVFGCMGSNSLPGGYVVDDNLAEAPYTTTNIVKHMRVV